MSKEYYIGDSDFWGNNSPNDKFNKELVPLLKKLGVKSEIDLDKIANIVNDISSMSYENGYDNCEKENQEYYFVGTADCKVAGALGLQRGEFLGNSVDSFESRALAPHSEGAEIHYYQLVEDYEFTTGKAAPWFGSEGGAQQYVVYKPDGSKYTIKELEEAGIIEDVTELVNKGEIVIE